MKFLTNIFKQFGSTSNYQKIRNPSLLERMTATNLHRVGWVPKRVRANNLHTNALCFRYKNATNGRFPLNKLLKAQIASPKDGQKHAADSR